MTYYIRFIRPTRFVPNSGRTAAVFLLLLITAAGPPAQSQLLPRASSVVEGEGLSIPVYSGFDSLAPLFSAHGDTTLVINFWATWCVPCVEELPYFEELALAETSRPLQIVLVSLDFRAQLKKRLLPFVRKHALRSRVVVLDDPDGNSWINRVDPSWSGAIPATLIIRGDKREFREQSFTRDELHSLVESFTGTDK